MKTFNAEEFNKKPHIVYREADKNGSVRINHLHYKDRIFEITCRDRRQEPAEQKQETKTE